MILERVKGERFSRVLPLWQDFAAVLIAGGPSLTREQVDLVRDAREADKVRVVTVNDGYLIAPWSELNYAADAKWYAWHAAGVEKPALGLTAEDVRLRWRAYGGERCSIAWGNDTIADERVHVLRNMHDDTNHGTGLSRDPGRLVTGRNSGFQALNLAVLAGAKKVILLGYDGQPGPNGLTHWHGGHPKPSSGIYDLMRQAFSAAEHDLEAAGVHVVNCSPGSAFNSFPKADLAETLEALP